MVCGVGGICISFIWAVWEDTRAYGKQVLHSTASALSVLIVSISIESMQVLGALRVHCVIIGASKATSRSRMLGLEIPVCWPGHACRQHAYCEAGIA